MKVLLVGHDGRSNRGCEAIVLSTIKMLRQEFGEKTEIVISSFEPTLDSQFNWGQGVKVVPAKDGRLWEKYTLPWFLAKFIRRIFKDAEWKLVFSPFIKDLKAADLVLSVGGDNYTDDYAEFYDPLMYYLFLNQYVKDCGKPLVIWSASVGPFKRLDRIEFVVGNLKKADLITVREQKSFDYLAGLGFKNIKRVADVAFNLPVEEKKIDVLSSPCSFLLGFNVSPLIGEYYSEVNKDFIIKQSTQFLKGIIREHKAKVILIPHVVKEDLRNNDFHFMSAILKEIDSENVELVGQNNNSMQLKYIISKCRFFIGARTHSTIAAFSTGVPTLSIGYSQKSVGINQDLFGHANYLLDVKDFSSDNLGRVFARIVADENQIRAQLSETIPKVKEMARDNFRLLKGILSNVE